MRPTCDKCRKPIKKGELQWHHPVPQSEGGTTTVPVCRACHIRHHSEAGDFARWGRMGGLIVAEGAPHVWARNLRNVNRHMAYAPLRQMPGLRYSRPAAPG